MAKKNKTMDRNNVVADLIKTLKMAHLKKKKKLLKKWVQEFNWLPRRFED